MATISTGIDYYLAYQFVKKLSTPFKETEAYKLGIIDEKGKVLKKRSRLTSKERESYKLMDTLIFNIKKFLEKLPGGKSKIGSLAAALMLIKEQRSIDELVNDENLENAFYFTWVDLHDLREMTLRERKEVLRIYNNQIERLLKIVS